MEILSRVDIARSYDSTRKVFAILSRNSEVWHASCVVGHLDLTYIVIFRDWKAYAGGSRSNYSQRDSCFLTLQKQRYTLKLVHASTKIHQEKRKVWTEVGLLKCRQIRNSYSGLESESRCLRKTPWHCADEYCLIICAGLGWIWCCWVRLRDVTLVRCCICGCCILKAASR